MGYNQRRSKLPMNRTTSTAPAKPPVALIVNGKLISVAQGASVAAVLMQTATAARKSVSGKPRNALCAMGVCMECCATVNGIKHVRTCQIIVQQGMDVVTG